MKPFCINLGIKIDNYIYRIAVLNLYYKSISNTRLWNRGWKKIFWKIYFNKIPYNKPRQGK